jgi:hypothetical protein
MVSCGSVRYFIIKMDNITKVRFGIEGISPLKMDRWTDLPSPKNENEAQKQAPQKVYRCENGELGIPAAAIKAVMVLGIAEAGRRMESKRNKQTIKSGVFLSSTMLSIGKTDYDEIAVDIIVRKGTGGKDTRVPTYRPLIKDWACEGELLLYGVSSDLAKQSLEIGGLRFALLGHRPEFGRFIITKWEVVE